MMTKHRIKAIIVDDEESARNVLERILNTYVDGIEVVATCQEVESAVEKVRSLKPDVVFLDIEMPNYSGFEFLDFFDNIEFEVIFVSAYGDYAVRAFEVSAVDYILKPIEIDKVENAVKKLRNKMHLSNVQERFNTLQQNLTTKQVHKLALPMSSGLLFVDTKDISHLVADGSYTHVYLDNGKRHVISKKLKFFENALNDNNDFMRVHRSSIVNLTKITAYNKQDGILSFGEAQIKIARDRKNNVETRLVQFRV